MPATSKVVQAYLNFDGRCEEAVEFYRHALGAEVDVLMRFKDAPGGDCGGGDAGERPPVSPDKIMHTSFRIGETTVMASDCHAAGAPEFKGVSLALALSTEADAEQYFNALAEGGKVAMPLAKTFWSQRFGVVIDRFGVNWMVNVVA